MTVNMTTPPRIQAGVGMPKKLNRLIGNATPGTPLI